MIKGFKIKNLRTFEFCQFLDNVLSVIRRYDSAKLDVTDLYDTLLIYQQRAFRLTGSTTKSPFTQELDAIDERRDKAYRGIRGLVEAMTLHYDAAIVQHAQQLLKHLSFFGAVDREGDISETMSISTIVQQWTDKPLLAAAIIALGLTGWKAELEAANKVYEERKLDKMIAIGTGSKEKFKAVRTAATAAYQALRIRLNSVYVVYHAAEPYNEAINTLNELISDYKTLLVRRQSNSKQKGAAEGETE